MKTANPNQAPSTRRSTLSPMMDDRVRVDPAANNGLGVIFGRVAAEVGVFKDKRGEFDLESLQQIARLGNSKLPKGLLAGVKHATMSDDGVGRHLGRDRNFRLDTSGDVPKIRVDTYISKLARQTPPEGGGKPWGDYVMELAMDDPGALSSSLVLDYKLEYHKDGDGNDRRDVPAIWRPVDLYALDVVRVGDAVNDFLSVDPTSQMLAKASEMISQVFDLNVISPEILDQRLTAWKDKLISFHFPENPLVMSESHAPTQASPTTTPQAPATTQEPTSNASLQDQIKLLELRKEVADKELETAKLRAANNQNPGVVATQPIQTLTAEPNTQEDVSKKILALCTAQGHPDKALGFINEELSVNQVKDKLLELNRPQTTLSPEVPTPGTGGTGGGTTEKTLDEQLREEFEAECRLSGATLLSFKDWKKDELINRGIEEETALLSNPAQAIGPMDEGMEPLNDSDLSSLVTTVGMLLAVVTLGALVAFAFGAPVQMIAMTVGISLFGMATTTTDQIVKFSGQVGNRVRGKIAGSISIPDGTPGFQDAGGDVTNITNSGANQFHGIACARYDNSSGSDGDLEGEFIGKGTVTLVNISHSLTDADLQKTVYFSDNNTLTITATSNSIAGVLVDIDGNSDPVVDLDRR